MPVNENGFGEEGFSEEDDKKIVTTDHKSGTDDFRGGVDKKFLKNFAETMYPNTDNEHI